MYNGLQKGFSEDFLNDIISEESCNYDSLINNIEISKQAKMIANYILWCFNRTSTKTTEVTYGDVSRNILARYKINISPNAQYKQDKKGIHYENKSIGGYSDDINDFCAKYALPFITGKIVSNEQKQQNKYIPQIGFFKSLAKYNDVYKYNLPTNQTALKKLSNLAKEAIIEDIDKKITDNFNEIVETFKLLNDKKYWIIPNKGSNKILSNDEISFIEEIENIDGVETEKTSIIKTRVGQSGLKQQKLQDTKCCELCGITTTELLISSHIKPWCNSTNYEKLDKENILLLCPMHDALFDKGFITFNSDGKIFISKKLPEEEWALLNINSDSQIKITSEKKANYIQYHYNNIFIDNKET